MFPIADIIIIIMAGSRAGMGSDECDGATVALPLETGPDGPEANAGADIIIPAARGFGATLTG